MDKILKFSELQISSVPYGDFGYRICLLVLLGEFTEVMSVKVSYPCFSVQIITVAFVAVLQNTPERLSLLT
jgi:hypothetical protein